MPSTTLPDKLTSRQRSCGVARRDLVSTPFKGVGTSPPAPHVTARSAIHRPAGHRCAPALASALGGTRARTPKAEHAGRTTTLPRGGNCISPPTESE